MKHLIIIIFLILAFCQSRSVIANDTITQYVQSFEKRCQETNRTLLASYYALDDANAKESFEAIIKHLENETLPALNLINEIKLIQTITSKSKFADKAALCNQSLQGNLDRILASKQVKMWLDKAATMAKEPIEQRVLKHYQLALKKLSTIDFVKQKTMSKTQRDAFIKVARSKPVFYFQLSKNCIDKLPSAYASQFSTSGKSLVLGNTQQYLSLMKQLPDSLCRQSLYSQYESRHKLENEGNLVRLIESRQLQAVTLGYKNYSDYLLDNASLNSVDQVNAFIEKMASKTGDVPLPWDYRIEASSKNTNKTQQTHTKISSDAVLAGLFSFLSRELGLVVVPVERNTWDKSVKAYQLLQNKALLGYFYLDLHTRKHKPKTSKHVALTKGITNEQLPASAIVMSLPKNQWAQSDINAFFHQFGHLLQNMYAVQPYHAVAGNALEKDLVEMPAKLFEWLSLAPQVQKNMFGKVLVSRQDPLESALEKIRLYKASVALQYHTGAHSTDALARINAQQFKHVFSTQYPVDTYGQYSNVQIASLGPLSYSSLYADAFSRKILQEAVDGNISGRSLLEHIFGIGGAKPMIEVLAELSDESVSKQNMIDWMLSD